MDWFLYDIGLCHERVKGLYSSRITSFKDLFLSDQFLSFLKSKKKIRHTRLGAKALKSL